jgi:hypothetical protein
MSTTIIETAEIPVVESLEPACDAVDHALEATGEKPVMEKLENVCEVVDYGYRGLEHARKLCDRAVGRMNEQPLKGAAVCVGAGVALGLLAGWVFVRPKK